MGTVRASTSTGCPARPGTGEGAPGRGHRGGGERSGVALAAGPGCAALPHLLRSGRRGRAGPPGAVPGGGAGGGGARGGPARCCRGGAGGNFPRACAGAGRRSSHHVAADVTRAPPAAAAAAVPHRAHRGDGGGEAGLGSVRPPVRCARGDAGGGNGSAGGIGRAGHPPVPHPAGRHPLPPSPGRCRAVPCRGVARWRCHPSPVRDRVLRAVTARCDTRKGIP